LKYLVSLLFITFSSLTFAESKSDCIVFPYHIGDAMDWEGEYNGECKDGLANGSGVLSIFEAHQASGEPKAVLKGNFRTSFFIGDLTYTGDLLADRDRVVTKLGDIDGDEVWLHAAVEYHGPVLLCKPLAINIGVSNPSTYTDHKATQGLFNKAFALHKSICGGTDYSVPMAVVQKQEVFNPFPNGAEIYAELNHMHEGDFSMYRNSIANHAEYLKGKAEEEAAYQQLLGQLREKYAPILKAEGVESLVDVDILDKNPEQYSGRTVAILSRVGKVQSDGTVVMLDAEINYHTSYVILTGAEADTLPDEGFLLIAKVKGAVDDGLLLGTELSYRKHFDCEEANCTSLYDSELDKLF